MSFISESKRILLRAPKAIRGKLKLIGFLCGMAGVLLLWGSYFGMFGNSEKKRFAELVMNTQAFISRDTPGFEEFLKAFPPPDQFSPSHITGIADKELRIASASDVGQTVRYVVGKEWTHPVVTADQIWTAPVARFDQVKEWASETSFDLASLLLATIGVLILVPVEVYEYRQSKGKKQSR